MPPRGLIPGALIARAGVIGGQRGLSGGVTGRAPPSAPLPSGDVGHRMIGQWQGDAAWPGRGPGPRVRSAGARLPSTEMFENALDHARLFNQGDNPLCVGDNEPYYMNSDKDYAVPVHGQHRGIPHVEFEIRQDLIETPEGQDEWAEFLAGILREGLGRMREAGHI